MKVKKIMNRRVSIYLFSLLAIFFVATPISIEAQSQTDKKPIKYKKARALQTSTAKKMAKVYEALEEVDDTGNWEELSGSYRKPIRDAIRIAKKLAPTDMLLMPVIKGEA